MIISIITDTEDLLSVETTPEETVSQLKEKVSKLVNAPEASIVLIYNGNPMQEDKKTLKDFSIMEDDIIQLIRRPGAQQSTQRRNPREELRLKLKSSAYLLSEYQRRYPEIANVIDDPEGFERVVKKIEEKYEEKRRQEIEEINFINENPFDVEAQRKIENAIKKENINRNYEYAMEHHPEFFGDITMLYINCEMNGHPLKAFVDTGAQKTIMSPECVEACGMSYLIDDRFTGVAQGVGVAKILGVIHNANIKIGNSLFATTITVLENQKIDIILGLDMLKRHQVAIDLKEGALKIGNESVPFLAEYEIPKKTTNKEELQNQLKGKAAETSKPAETSELNIPSPSSLFPEETINELMEFGFSKEEVIKALLRSGGDKNMAGSLLFQNQ